MRVSFLFSLVLLTVSFLGCQQGGSSDAAVGTVKITASDGSARGLRASRAMAAPLDFKVSFRSSAIEFWAAGTDFSNLNSPIYTGGDEVNDAVVLTLSNTEDNVVFTPGGVNFNENSAPDFVAAVYNVVRMDIGAGEINYFIGGSKVDVEFSPMLTGLGQGGKLVANSIIFIDSPELTEIVYVDGPSMTKIGQRVAGAPSYGSFIDDFILNNYQNGFSSGTIDMNGALFLPFEAIDLSAGADGGATEIIINWDLDNVLAGDVVPYTDSDSYIKDSGDYYPLTDHTEGMPYNFSVDVNVD